MSDRRLERIRRRLVSTLAECDQLIADFEHVMERRPDLPPIDLEDVRVRRAGLRKALAALDAGEYIDPEWLG